MSDRIRRSRENLRRGRRPHNLSGQQLLGMAICGWASAPFRASGRSRTIAAKRTAQGRRPRHRDKHDSELQQQCPYHALLFVDAAAWTAAAMGANASGVVRLEGDSRVSLKSATTGSYSFILPRQWQSDTRNRESNAEYGIATQKPPVLRTPPTPATTHIGRGY